MTQMIEGSKWMLSDSVLLLHTAEGATVVPSAEQIFAMIFEGRPPAGWPSPSEIRITDASISFLRYPIDLEIRVETVESNGIPTLCCRVMAVGSDLDLEIRDAFDREADHLVAGQRWFPFAPGALDEVRSVLAKAGINQLGNISLRQFLELRRLAVEHRVIHDLSGSIGVGEGECIDLPSGFCGKLYPYQLQGLRWLRFIFREGLGGVLADEMGLGKTVQVIALLCDTLSDPKAPSLVISPGTVLENWRRELAKFAPGLKTHIHQGPQRTGFPSDLRRNDVVITSYDTLLRDGPLFRAIKWNVAILDEAQAIKNPQTKRATEIKRLNRRVSIAVTGTPLENRLTDLWSIVDFTLSGFLGPLKTFERTYSDERSAAAEVEPLVSPIILRRRIAQVAQDLPPRIEIPQILSLGPREAAQYEAIRMEAVTRYGPQAGLVALTRLRMYCTHPFLLSQASEDPPEVSEKYRRLLEILEETFASKEKVLLFTSFDGMIDILSADLPRRFSGFFGYIDGRVAIPERQPIVDEFTRMTGPGILLLNPRAAGTGMNITAAVHVIHYNLEWNPAVEDQASARAHRLGQQHPVRIHRLIYAATVEEVIDRRLTHKRQLAQAAVVGTRGEEEDYKYIVDALKTSPVLAAH